MVSFRFLMTVSVASIVVAVGCSSNDRPSYVGDFVNPETGGFVNGGTSGLGSVGGAAGSSRGGSSGSDADASSPVDASSNEDQDASSTQGGTGGQGGVGGHGGVSGNGGIGGQGGTGGQSGSGGQGGAPALPIVGHWTNSETVGCTETHVFGPITNGNGAYTITSSSGKVISGLYTYTAGAQGARGQMYIRYQTDNLEADCNGSSLSQANVTRTEFPEFDQTMNQLTLYRAQTGDLYWYKLTRE